MGVSTVAIFIYNAQSRLLLSWTSCSLGKCSLKFFVTGHLELTFSRIIFVSLVSHSAVFRLDSVNVMSCSVNYNCSSLLEILDEYSMSSRQFCQVIYFFVPLPSDGSGIEVGLAEYLVPRVRPGCWSRGAAARIWADAEGMSAATFSTDNNDEEDLVEVLDAEGPALRALASGQQ